jgi:hypothetical protein
MSHRRANSNAAEGGPTGRPLAQEPRSASVRKTVFPSQVFSRPVSASPVPSYRSYRESKQRHQEKEEARELRDALQGLDLEDDVRLHQAAQDEATELVWMHQNPGLAYKNPYAPYHNPDTMGRDPSVRSQSRKGSASGSSSIKHRHSIASSGSSSGPSSPEFAEAGKASSARRRSSLAGTLKKKVNFALPEEEKPLPKPRTVSGDSSKGVFRNPEDHIYEEPQTVDPSPTSPNQIPQPCETNRATPFRDSANRFPGCRAVTPRAPSATKSPSSTSTRTRPANPIIQAIRGTSLLPRRLLGRMKSQSS